MPLTEETPLDVSRQAARKLMSLALERAANAKQHSFEQLWWEGYARGIEDVLLMEYE